MVFIKIVNAKINKTQLQQTRVSIKPQIESASSKIVASRCPPIAFDIVANTENESLFKNKLIIMGSIRTAIDIIPIIPQELLIKERLAVTVRRDSFIDEPTKGTKLLIANLAVFTEMESTLCAMVFL